jgi:ammonium transporter Rh
LWLFKALDIGGAMTIHTFGAYFGLAASFFFQNKAAIEDKYAQNKGSYYSNLIAALGTFFLFCFWPSFNAAPGEYASQ